MKTHFSPKWKIEAQFWATIGRKSVYMPIKTTVRSKHSSKEGTQEQSTDMQNFLGHSKHGGKKIAKKVTQNL